MPSQHAFLSPSAAYRWMNCPAAPKLEAGVPDKGSEYAEEGTLAHAYCAKKLKSFLHLSTEDEDREIKELDEKYHNGEMDEATDFYKTIVLENLVKAKQLTRDARLLVETRLDFGSWIPEAFGTSDAIIIADGLMQVIDFKYGKGVKVDADHNFQMMIYALGAFSKYNFEYDIHKICMTIIQPRIDNVSEFTMSAKDLLRWAIKVLKPAAEEAYRGTGEQHAGAWCQFCKVKATCRELADSCKEAAKLDFKLLKPHEVAANILPLIPIIKSWLTAVDEYTLQQALSGTEYPGWKVVEGRSNRKIKDPEKVEEILNSAGFDDEAILRPAELKTITDLEKLVGKKTFTELCFNYIEKPAGKPTMAPESDKRPPMNSAANDFKDIEL